MFDSQHQASTPIEQASINPRIRRTLIIATIALILIFTAVFLVAILLAILTNFEQAAARIRYVRDIVLIIIPLLCIILIIEMAILIFQITRLLNLTTSSIRPILHDARQTTQTTKATVGFVSEQAAKPIIKSSAFLAALRAFLRDLIALRRTIQPAKSSQVEEHETGE